MQVLTETNGQPDLPRYFAQVFEIAKGLKHGRLEFHLPGDRIFRIDAPNPGPVGICEVHDPDVFARLIREGDLGFCDAYIEGGWSTPDLQAFLDMIHADNYDVYNGFAGMALVRIYERLRHLLRSNSKRQARRNISYHYDLGNEFYQLWLDDSMTYSSALFDNGQVSTEAAQRRKYEALVDSIDVKEGDHVLEIGCGWGGFAEYAAGERGLKVTGLTISQEQFDYAQERINRAGLSDRVEFRMQDYRDTRGQYDAIASIEMFEAVGEKYWPGYFETLVRCLRPGGKAGLQIITLDEKNWNAYRKGVDFIQKYIFPGGMVPTHNILKTLSRDAGLEVVASREFGQSYSQTLRRWHGSFNEHWDEIAQMGFDDRFRRMWNFYLTSCAAAFKYGNTDVTQITLAKPG